MRLLIFILCLIPSIAIGGQFDAVVQQYNAAGGATGLSKTSLVAWYDFGDATDAHASYDLTEDNSPSYTSGPPNYGSATAASSQQWHTTATTGMTSVWAPDTATDITLVIRFKIGASVTNGNYVFKIGRASCRERV